MISWSKLSSCLLIAAMLQTSACGGSGGDVGAGSGGGGGSEGDERGEDGGENESSDNAAPVFISGPFATVAENRLALRTSPRRLLRQPEASRSMSQF